MKQWYVAYTRPREESLAREHLNRQGFDVYLPQYLKRRSHARRIDTVPAPLFPRYLFVAFDIAESAWRVIHSTRGIVDLVRNGVDPIVVKDGIIANIKGHEDEAGFVPVGKKLRLAPGDSFRIDGGAFSGLTAIFEAIKDSERVFALLSLLGRKVSVQVPIKYVAPV